MKGKFKLNHLIVHLILLVGSDRGCISICMDDPDII